MRDYQHAVKPGCELRGEVSIPSALSDDSAFNLADRHYADEKITRSLTSRSMMLGECRASACAAPTATTVSIKYIKAQRRVAGS